MHDLIYTSKYNISAHQPFDNDKPKKFQTENFISMAENGWKIFCSRKFITSNIALMEEDFSYNKKNLKNHSFGNGGQYLKFQLLLYWKSNANLSIAKVLCPNYKSIFLLDRANAYLYKFQRNNDFIQLLIILCDTYKNQIHVKLIIRRRKKQNHSIHFVFSSVYFLLVVKFVERPTETFMIWILYSFARTHTPAFAYGSVSEIDHFN